MNVAAPLDAFTRLESLGYGPRLIPIIPPGAPLAPDSTILAAGRGKAPGERRADGLWQGLPWRDVESTHERRALWSASGAGVGLRTGDGLLAIDADVRDEAYAAIVDEEVQRLWPNAPKRVGQAPKALFLMKTGDEAARVRKLKFGDGHVIDFRYAKLQFVVHGVHPKTLGPYVWVRGLPHIDDLPTATATEIDTLVERLSARLPQPETLKTVGLDDREAPDPKTLTGRLEDVRAALKLIPNDGRFSDRGKWLDMAYALRGALPDDSENGLSLFKEFSERWSGGDNDDEYVEKTWRSLEGPFRVGAPWIFEQARKATGGSVRLDGAQWFEQPDLSAASSEPTDELDAFLNRDLAANAPEQRWCVRDWIPHGQTTILSGDGGTGKSLIALQLAIAGDLGREWMGQAVAPGPVLFLTAEDDRDEIHRRQSAILRHYGAAPSDLSERLHTVSLHGRDAVLATLDAKNPMLLKATRLMQRLDKTLARLRPTLVILDTQADLFGGKENERAHARQFIGFLQRIAQTHDCAVLLLAHPSMSGMASGSGTSGVTAWSNSVRSRLYLSREVDKDNIEPDPDFRTLTVKKANRGRVGLSLGLHYRGGVFEISEKTVEAVDQRADEILFLKLLNRHNENMDWLSLAQNSKRYAPRAMAAGAAEGREIGLLRLELAMNRMLDSGAIYQEQFGKASRPSFRLLRRDDEMKSENSTFW